MHRFKAILKFALVIFFVLAGLNHFLHTDFYVRIMPPYLPCRAGRRPADSTTDKSVGMGLIALLIAVFPANIHMALHPDLFPEFNPAMLWLRLPLQLVLMAWAYTLREADKRRDQGPVTTAL